MIKTNVIYTGNSLDILKSIDDCSIDCCITSPPYWGLRDYGTAQWEGGNPDCEHKVGRATRGGLTSFQAANKGCFGYEAIKTGDACPHCGAVRKDAQLGLEKTPEEYVANMVAIFREVRRVLKDDGTLWLNLGDSYASMGGSMCEQSIGNQDVYKNRGQSDSNGVGTSRKHPEGLKRKDLVGIPWMVAFALRSDGWYLRQDIIWHKPNPMPESVTDRCTKAHEYIFLMTKSAKYYYDYEAIKENCESVCERKRSSAFRQQNENPDTTLTTIGRNKRSVWTVTTKPFKGSHFATFPQDLIQPMILTTRKDAVILDPFFGSGTTGVVAIEYGRKYVGIELNPDYVKMATERIYKKTEQEELF